MGTFATLGSGHLATGTSARARSYQQVSYVSPVAKRLESGGHVNQQPSSNPNEPPTTDRSSTQRIANGEFLHLHNVVALPLMRNADDLGKAFWAFMQANDVHKKLTGQQSGEALYNSACCLSRAVEEQLKRSRINLRDACATMTELARAPVTPGGIVAPDLPPGGGANSLHAIVNARLDMALNLLSRSLDEGCATHPSSVHMQSDADLKVVRDLRVEQFRAVLQQAGQRQTKVATFRVVASSAQPVAVA